MEGNLNNAIVGISVAAYLALAMERLYLKNIPFNIETRNMIIEMATSLAWQVPQTRNAWAWNVLKNKFVVNLSKHRLD